MLETSSAVAREPFDVKSARPDPVDQALDSVSFSTDGFRTNNIIPSVKLKVVFGPACSNVRQPAAVEPAKLSTNIQKDSLWTRLQSFADSRTVRISCTSAAVGLFIACGVGEILQMKYGNSVFPILTRHGGNAPHCFNLMWHGLIWGEIASQLWPKSYMIQKLKRHLPEVTGTAVASLIVIGETVLPQALGPNYSDPRDIPMALLMTGLCYIGFARYNSKHKPK